MDILSSQTCVSCGRVFTHAASYTKHKKACQKGKRRLSSALEIAKKVWNQKRCRVSALDSTSEHTAFSPPGSAAEVDTATIPEPSSQISDDHTSLAQRRERRLNRRLPRRFQDFIPELPHPLPPAPPACPDDLPADPSPNPSHNSDGSSAAQTIVSRVQRVFSTQRNTFGLVRRYFSARPPSHDPDDPPPSQTLPDAPRRSDAAAAFYPYPNESAFRLGDWYWNQGAQKSQESFRQLLDIVGKPDFVPKDVQSAKWGQINRVLGHNDFDGEDAGWDDCDAGWKCTPVSIPVPFHSRTQNPGSHNHFTVEFHHRSLISILREKLANPQADRLFHYDPYELLWQSADGRQETRVHGELYTSPAFLEADQDLQNSPPEPGCDLPRVVAAMMFSSDSTHLTSFGNTKLWPLYLYFGNESKYRRCKPSCNLCNHAAYFQKLPDEFKDFVTTHNGPKTLTDVLLAHCHRELFHSQWRVLLDEEFREAYKHGIVITCCDGIQRRFYPRIFTYSADYPEKILIATIRNLGGCPCPRCLIPMARVSDIGKERDMLQRTLLARTDNEEYRRKITSARKFIYEKNYAVNYAKVEELLKPESLLPTSNAFSDALAPFGFNLFAMLVVDLMHEFELGVWKAIFMHLLRILDSMNKGLLDQLDYRYRQVPTFGRDTIRRFARNVSEMKHITAHDFEDLLQCAIPVFDSLLPEPHNSSILRLLFLLAHWHGLAKLRMHTDSSLCIMDHLTTAVGDGLRAFQLDTCSAFQTKELEREAEARKRRILQHGPAQPSRPTSSQNRDGRRPKDFNMQTYKIHALGDYAAQIRRFGTTDSYSTEPGELEHRTGKSRYTRTSRKFYIQQLARIERRQARIRRIRERLQGTATEAEAEGTVATSEVHHIIGKSQNLPVNVTTFVRTTAEDPATKGFVIKLKAHLLLRIKAMLGLDLGVPSEGDPVAGHLNHLQSVILKNDCIYKHNLLRINYTTYDVRREQDVINPRTEHCNVMFLSKDDSEHHFCYAKVLGIYHANVIYVGQGMADYRSRHMEFLWVRWYEMVGSEAGSTGSDTELDTVQFVPMAEVDAFGFVDPSDVMRSCHLIPAFSTGKLHSDGIAMSYCAQDGNDWKSYYINRFVDRDMLMRYHHGLAVGHVYAHENGLGSMPTRAPGADSTTDSQGIEDADDSVMAPDHHYQGDDVEEMLLEDREADGLDLEGSEEGGLSGNEDQLSDAEYLAMDEMYGLSEWLLD
ncbi:hypothetical protein BV22DRAFT_1025919 [Leucogyrophana mollusca]|uniref:Uncharacterized protein n=1 Tax=Leucogyrophana mollusca TaxID=85980 RepID=A0ACB8AWT7_9AGAM|nr:hypothetical protein BV22DRAFT_1025919 [Leucogyrophana mollusca]